MNRRTTIFGLLLLAVVLLLPRDSYAQIRVGAAFGSDTEFGITGGYYLPISVGEVEGLSVGGDLTYYLGNDDFFGVDASFLTIDVNGHYEAVEVGDDVGILYAIGGLQYFRWNFETDFPGASTSSMGLNIGAGIDFGRFYADAKFDIGNLEQLVLAGGVTF